MKKQDQQRIIKASDNIRDILAELYKEPIMGYFGAKNRIITNMLKELEYNATEIKTVIYFDQIRDEFKNNRGK